LFSPAGLRVEISCESDKKKMNFIFNYAKKIFLTEKMKRVRRRENRNSLLKNIVSQPRRTRNHRTKKTSLLIELRIPS